MNRMLASVQSVPEAAIALESGVDWVDVKDPLAGALGAAPKSLIVEIARLIDGRRPVSATLGDTWQTTDQIPARAKALAETGVDFVKAGVDVKYLTARSIEYLSRAAEHGPPLIIVCAAESPPTVDDIQRLATCGIAGIMLDTMEKNGPRLIDLVTTEQLIEFVCAARATHLICGLAGRLKLTDIRTLTPLNPDYLGFRSALCCDGDRRSSLDHDSVRRVAAEIAHQSGLKSSNNSREVA